MKLRLSLILTALLLACGVVRAQSYGTYTGDLDVMGQKLTLFFTLTEESDGTTSAELDVPAQGAKGIPVTVVTNTATELSLDIPLIGAKYSGTIDGDTISGTYEQMGSPFPLVLTRSEEGVATKVRPQDPQPPFPYRTEEVVIPGKVEGVTLAGTLTYPVEGSYTTDQPRLVVLVTGSGQQNRDEEIFDHRPFAVLADYLARQGIATLRYDDRGMGQSVGPIEHFTTADVALDAEAAIDFARNLGVFSSVGVLGHSEGGSVVFILGAKGVPDFGIAMAAQGLKGERVATDQVNYSMQQSGMDLTVTTEQVRAQMLQQENPWMEYFLDYDPAADIRGTTMPVLVLSGENDRQIFFPDNFDEIKTLLPKGDRTLFRSYPGLNHLFQTSKTGDPQEYYSIDETIAPAVLRDISDWINAL